MAYDISFYVNSSDPNKVTKDLAHKVTFHTDYLKHGYNYPNIELVVDYPNGTDIYTQRKYNYMTIKETNVPLMCYFIDSMTVENHKLYITGHKDLVSTYWGQYKNIDMVISTTEKALNPDLPDKYILSSKRELKYAKGNRAPFSTTATGGNFVVEICGGAV